MKKNALLIWLAFTFSSISTAQSLFPQWISNHTHNVYSCQSLGIVVDSLGNSYVLDYIQDTSLSPQNISGNYILKYDPLGQLMWIDSISGLGLYSSKLLSGKDGCVYVGSKGPGGLKVSKISPNGNFIWRNNFPTVHLVNSLNDMVISDSLNIYLISTSSDLNTTEILKCDSAGNCLWSTSYDYLPGRYDRGNAIAVDHAGNAYAAIGSMDSISNYSYVIAKYSAAGQLIWQQRSNPFLNQVPSFINVFQDTVIIVAGGCYNIQGHGDFLTQRYNKNGSLVWSTTFDADSFLNLPYYRQDTPTAMLVTHTGNTVITGRCADSGMCLWMNVMYDLQGNLKWVRQDFGAASRPNSITEDPDSHLIFAGDATDSLSPYGMGISKYDTLGNLLWSSVYHYLPQTTYLFTRVGVDHWGNIYCTSTARIFSSFDVVTTLKYDHSVNIEEENPTGTQLLIYPNPATDHVTFQLSGFSGEVTIYIYNQLGKEIWKKETNENQIEFPAENFAAGLYFYRIEKENSISQAGKLIIQ